ncbi:xanthine dehydrogenase family protein molybdopterin-binding subunit [Sedimentitalea sp. XS_ASV28]|uniref:xanthine dehydrogenase family protein molybdopterin-binding subunit n=1 Tax=Sedimentitalea sp. XS_ASV28 TaxID=3241296 RepID=UPI0035110895
MDKFGKSQSVTRIEDKRFLTGSGHYIADGDTASALHCYVLRSEVAHGRITALDIGDAQQAAGVHLVVTASDLTAAGGTNRIEANLVQNRDGTMGAAPARPILASDRVRFVGEPIVAVIAETLHAARDAAEMIVVEIDELPVKLDVRAGGETLHPEAPDNRAFDWGTGDGDATDAAFEAAARVVRLEVEDNRIITNSMEPRGCRADWDGARLHFAFSGQGVWAMKDRLATMLGLQPDAVHVTIPDVGGGFGMKVMPYPEYGIVAHAARTLGRPVSWMGERTESMLSDNAGRDLTTLAELAFDGDGRITAYRVHSRINLGAYNGMMGQPIQTELFSRVLMGCYDVQTVWMRAEGFYTNTTQVDAYRGAGRPEAIYVLERAMDRAARELGIDPWELRRRNFIPADRFPYLSATGETYDVGDFHKVLARAAQTADHAGFAARRDADAARGLLRGQGLCYYIESILGDPSEGARIVFEEDGTVSIHVGTQSNGQGHETVYARFLADQTGIPVASIRVVQGDSDIIPQGGGTGGSRSVTTQANAMLATVAQMMSALMPYLADKLGVDLADLSFDDETFRAAGSNMTPSLLEVAEMARADGRADLLDHAARATLPARSFPNGAHVAEVVVDPETGVVRVDRYTVVDDFGNLINPLLAEGQVHGGVVQGLGQALCEHVVHDAEGQLLTASFMDYALPRAGDVPMIGFTSEPVPSTANPMGMKGCGEAGTVGSMAAVANAVQDALWVRGVRQADMPFTPMRVWSLLQNEPVAAEK